MYCKYSMMGYEEIIQAVGRWPIEPIPKAIIGRPYAQMQSPMSRSVTVASDRSPILKVPAQDLTTITSPWPFAQWGMDIVGPFPINSAQKKLLLVSTDYFINLIEA